MSDLLPTAILVPSLNRPQRLRGLVNNIHEATRDKEHTIFFMVSDEKSKDILTDMGERFIDDSDTEDRRYVTRMNRLVKEIRPLGFKAVFFGSDDVIHHYGWLREGIRELENSGNQIVVVNDLRNHNGTQGLVRMEYLPLAVVDAPEDAFHSGYLHNFADTEQFYTAFKRGVIGRAMESYVEHLHPVFAQNSRAIPWDDTYHNAVKGWDHDAALYERRTRLIDATLAAQVEGVIESSVQ